MFSPTFHQVLTVWDNLWTNAQHPTRTATILAKAVNFLRSSTVFFSRIYVSKIVLLYKNLQPRLFLLETLYSQCFIPFSRVKEVHQESTCTFSISRCNEMNFPISMHFTGLYDHNQVTGELERFRKILRIDFHNFVAHFERFSTEPMLSYDNVLACTPE